MQNDITLTAEQLAEIGRECVGGAVVVAEYRSSDIRVFKKEDERTGTAVSNYSVAHVLEVAGKRVVVTERLPDGSDGKSFAAPAKRGEIVFIACTKWDNTSFRKDDPIKASGHIVRFGALKPQQPRLVKEVKP